MQVLGTYPPPLKLIEFINEGKATKIKRLLSKISSLAHFSQSMTDYFASDDALEPALAVICEVLRGSDDIGGVLKNEGTSFLRLAQPYEKNRSPGDHDVTEKKPKKSSVLERGKSGRLICWDFQKGSCKSKSCKFSHECKNCSSKNHGAYACTRKSKRSRSRKSKD